MVEEGLKKDELQLWTDKDMAVVTAMIEDYCLLLVCGGNGIETCIKGLPVIEEWAKNNGKKEMRIYGRKGWARVLNYEIAGTGYGKPFLRKIL